MSRSQRKKETKVRLGKLIRKEEELYSMFTFFMFKNFHFQVHGLFFVSIK